MEKKKSHKLKSKTAEGRKQLASVRVIQKNLVYVVGLPLNFADEDVSASPFFCLGFLHYLFFLFLLPSMLVCSFFSAKNILASMGKCLRSPSLAQLMVPYSILQIVHAVCKLQAFSFKMLDHGRNDCQKLLNSR